MISLSLKSSSYTGLNFVVHYGLLMHSFELVLGIGKSSLLHVFELLYCFFFLLFYLNTNLKEEKSAINILVETIEPKVYFPWLYLGWKINIAFVYEHKPERRKQFLHEKRFPMVGIRSAYTLLFANPTCGIKL